MATLPPFPGQSLKTNALVVMETAPDFDVANFIPIVLNSTDESENLFRSQLFFNILQRKLYKGGGTLYMQVHLTWKLISLQSSCMKYYFVKLGF